MWVDLQIKYLFTLKTKDAIRKKLGKLPKSLEETYRKIYDTISREDSEELEVTKRALMWLMCSRRPLSSQEWASVSYWPELADQDTGADPLLEMCHNLVAVDNQSQVVRFAHLSVQEYLEKLDDFTVEKTNSMAARFCLSVLLSDDISIPSLLGEAYDYSAGYWMEHASQCTGSQDVLDLLRSFLGKPAKPGRAYCNWFRLASVAIPSRGRSRFRAAANFEHLHVSFEHLHSEPLNPVFAVCYFRLGAGLQDFWDWDAFDIDSRNGCGDTLIYIASLTGNEQIVKYLLENGADVNTPSWKHRKDFQNPLMAAITHFQARIAVTLLNYGGSVGFPGEGFHRNTLEFAAEHGDEYVVEAIINRGCNTKVTEVILVAAAGNSHHGGNVLKILLARDSTVEITEAVLLAAAKNSTEKALESLLACDSTIQITEAILSAAAENWNKKVLEMLLARDSTIQITDAVLSAAVRNSGTGVLELLLARGSTIQITEAVLSVAAENLNKRSLEMLLAHDPTIQITEAVLSAAVRNSSIDVLELLLARGSSIQITEAVLLVAAKNRYTNTLEILLAHDSTIQITDAILSAAAGSPSTDALGMLLACDSAIQITEAVLLVAAKNPFASALGMLLAYDYTIQTTETLLSAATENSSTKDLEALFARDSAIQTTDALLSAAAESGSGKALEVLLARDSTIQITEALLSAVAEHCNEKALEMLLARDSTILITEAILSEAVGSSSSKVLEMLLARDPTIQITETVLSVAAGNHSTEALEMLLARDSTIQITKTVLSVAAGNHSTEALEMLLARGSTIQIAETVLLVAAENDSTEALKMLLAWDSIIQITEAVLSRAVEGASEALEILLARENNIEITEAILTSAAGNYRRSEYVKVLAILARNAGNTNITVSSTALKASAYFASSFLFHKFLRKCDRSSIIGVKYPQFVYAAVQGGDGNILRALLKLGGECLEADEHGWTLRMVERQSGFANEMLPSGAPNHTHHRSEAPKLAAGIGHCAQIQVSEPTALDISRLPECINLQGDGSYMFYSGKCQILAVHSTSVVLIVEGMSNKPHCAHTVKANHPFPPGYLGLNYFEVTILKYSKTRYAIIGERRRIK